MNEYFFFVVILLPIIGGALLAFITFKKRKHLCIYIESIILLTSVLVFALILNKPEEAFRFIKFTGNISISFKMDGLSIVFAGLVAGLWPLASLYAFEYMKHEKSGEVKHEKAFFMMFTMTFGVTLGIALAGNMLTMYCFYEMLTLVTLPLIMYTLSREAILASRKYLYYSLGGAAFAFIGLIFMIVYGDSLDFVLGGTLNLAKIGNRKNILLLVYVLSFFGFGVKAALCPFHSWLPQASVAPTPVTALLHAVAVVKSGAFAIIRLTYYCFGVSFLKGSWAQNVVMVAVIVTIVYGCSMALKETHCKRRLAYSTVSNLSYILFGVAIMTPLGMVGALTHMVFHGVIKICAFFCVGAITYQTGKTFVHELDGLGRKMPKLFTIFTISGLALMGVPGLCGFISKWNLASAAVESAQTLAMVGIGALLVSAFLTAIYMIQMIVRGFFPIKEKEEFSNIVKTDREDIVAKEIKDPNWLMMLPLCILAIAMVVFGLYAERFVHFFTKVAFGN